MVAILIRDLEKNTYFQTPKETFLKKLLKQTTVFLSLYKRQYSYYHT